MSPREKALELALEEFLAVIPEPPEPNCYCHLSPPCNDCVENHGIREAFKMATEALAMPSDQAPKDDSLLPALQSIIAVCRKPLFAQGEEITLSGLCIRRGLLLTQIRGLALNAVEPKNETPQHEP